jgi:uncharacterized protein YlzI (FlbEa/FlbD family)
MAGSARAGGRDAGGEAMRTFERLSGELVALNPDHIVKVEAIDETPSRGSAITTTTGETVWVKEVLQEIMDRLAAGSDEA